MRSRYGHRHSSNRFVWLIVLIVAIAALSMFRLPWWLWLAFFMFGMPLLMGVVRAIGQAVASTSTGWGRYPSYGARPQAEEADAPYREKPKNRYTPERVDDLEADEKPKRRPLYTVGDDGELVEVADADEPPAYRRNDVV